MEREAAKRKTQAELRRETCWFVLSSQPKSTPGGCQFSFMESSAVLHVLRRNDPAVTGVTVALHQELQNTDDRALARALAANEHVSEVVIVFRWTALFVGTVNENDNSLPADGWPALRRVLSSKPSLRRIDLDGTFGGLGEEDRLILAPARALLKLFFEAIQQNDFVTEMILGDLPLPGAETAALLESMSGLKFFGWFRCTLMDHPDGHGGQGGEHDGNGKEEEAQALARALQRNENLEDLSLDCAEPCMLPVIQGLKLSKSLQCLHVCLVEGADNAPFLEAASKFHNVEMLLIDEVDSELDFQAVLQVIPHLRMRALAIVPSGQLWNTNVEHHLTRTADALKRNFKLFSVEAQSGSDVFLNESGNDTAALGRTNIEYQIWRSLRRSKLLADWIQHPGSLPKHLWPEALALARQAGEEMLWQGLLRVGPEIITTNRRSKKRKRKRTEFYDPSL